MSGEVLRLDGKYDIPTERRLIQEWIDMYPRGNPEHNSYLNNFAAKLPGAQRKGMERDKKLYENDDRLSPLLRGQTVGEFFDTIDGVLEQHGIMDKVLELNFHYEHLTELNGIILPAYFTLREQGYWRYDLVG